MARGFALVAVLSLLGLGVAPAAAQSDVTSYELKAEFEDVIADLEDAVINRGYVIDYRGNIGEMLKRTSADVGADKQLYRNAELIQFCSAVVSREAMEADIRNIAYCPYILFVYEAAQTPGTVRLGFRRLPDGPGRDQVNALLAEIAKEAASE